MTKTYKINGKEIKGFNISKDILGEFAPEHKIDELLEALSDKEEHLHTKQCMEGVENAVNNLKSVTNCAVCTGKLKEDVCFHCGGTGLHVYEEEFKSVCQKCPRYPNAIIGMLDKDGKCDKCTPKQSISLIKQIDDLTKWVHSDEKIEEIIQVIQSHLVKEIELLVPGKYTLIDHELSSTYTQAKLDIIKIINNLC